MASPVRSKSRSVCEHENCFKVTHNPREKILHDRYHSYVEYKCEECFYGFLSNKTFVQHQNNMHSERKYRCLSKNCSKSYGSRNSLFNHVALTINNYRNPARADHLDNTANLSAYTSTDRITSEAERVFYACSEYVGCSKVFSRAGDLRVHITKIHHAHQKILIELLPRKRELEESTQPPLKETASQEILNSQENNSQTLNIPLLYDSDTEESISDKPRTIDMSALFQLEEIAVKILTRKETNK